MVTYYILKPIHSGWIPHLKAQTLTKYIDSKNEITDNNYKIIPITVEQMVEFNNNDNSVFHNNINSINILDNKSMFAEFMMNNFPDNIPPCYYFNYNSKTYVNKKIKNDKMIIKPNNGYAANGIKIIYKLTQKRNSVISKYIQHTTFYFSHFLVINGKILKRIHFSAQTNNPNFIKKGALLNYNIVTMPTNDNIFDKIFEKLNYTGFAHSDFTIKNDTIIIFEIGSRMGGSLVGNDLVFHDFLTVLLSACTEK